MIALLLVMAAAAAAPSPSPSPSPRSFTNDDLDIAAGRIPGASPSPSPRASGRPNPSPTPRPAPVEQRKDPVEREWRERSRVARESVARNEQRAAEAQKKIDDLGAAPGPLWNLNDPNRDQAHAAALSAAREGLEAARAALDAARRILGELEDEARRKSVPPGWLREP